MSCTTPCVNFQLTGFYGEFNLIHINSGVKQWTCSSIRTESVKARGNVRHTTLQSCLLVGSKQCNRLVIQRSETMVIYRKLCK